MRKRLRFVFPWGDRNGAFLSINHQPGASTQKQQKNAPNHVETQCHFPFYAQEIPYTKKAAASAPLLSKIGLLTTTFFTYALSVLHKTFF